MFTKLRIAVALATALVPSVQAAYVPSQSELESDLASAKLQWGAPVEVSGVFFRDIGSCTTPNDPAGWADLVTHSITINSRCRFLTPEIIRAIMIHEVGHLLMGVGHSLDKKSIMFRIVDVSQKITEDDRERLKDALYRELPTLARPEEPTIQASK